MFDYIYYIYYNLKYLFIINYKKTVNKNFI